MIVLRKVRWSLPTTYTDGTPIPPEIIALLVTHIFRDGVEIAVSDPGATEKIVDVDETPGDTDEYYGRCEVAGIDDTLSAPGEVLVFQVPFLVASPPGKMSII
jgi:hypothetical protein